MSIILGRIICKVERFCPRYLPNVLMGKNKYTILLGILASNQNGRAAVSLK